MIRFKNLGLETAEEASELKVGGKRSLQSEVYISAYGFDV